MHVTSPFTAPELPLVNITTAICPSFPHSKWEFQKTWSLKGRKRKRKEKDTTQQPRVAKGRKLASREACLRERRAQRRDRAQHGKGERSDATARSTVARGVFKTLAEITYVGAGFRCVAVSVRSKNRLIDVIWPLAAKTPKYGLFGAIFEA